LALFDRARLIFYAKGGHVMKTVLHIIIGITFLALPGSSFAVRHGDAVDMGNRQPATTSDINIISSELAQEKKLEMLLLQLNDSDPFVRVEAVQSLGEIYKEKSLASVCDCLTDENLYVRAYAAEALGKIGQVDISLTLSRLLPALSDPSPYVRSMMALALGELQDRRGVDPLRELLLDEDESVRRMAAWALNKIENPQ
jgi:HEAT repeat protein